MNDTLVKNSDNNEWFKQRLPWAMAIVLAVFGALFMRLFYLQILEGPEYRRLSENNCIRLQEIPAPRGLIFDRNGRMLVDNRPSFNLTIVLKDARPLGRTLEKLSQLMGVSVAELKSRIAARKASAYKPIVLMHDMDRDLLAAVEVHRFDLPGVAVSVQPRRQYLNHDVAAHLIGYLGEVNLKELKSAGGAGYKPGDFIGKLGAEKTFEKLLRGKAGGRQVEVNAAGQVVRVLNTVDAKPGYNIYLTLDLALQAKARDLLEGLAGAVVAMDPNDGEILAMASSPSFDLNVFVSGLTPGKWRSLSRNPFRPLENKAIQGEYPPGSTYKIVTAIAGLEEGVIDENTTFFCPGFYRFGNRIYRCWKRGGHGNVNVVKALAESCDVFFYNVGHRLGVDRLAWYAHACGLGRPTGIALDHEAGGLIPTASWKRKRTGVPWQRGETLSVAIGQGYDLATPLQNVVMISAIANGGLRYQPMILKRIETAEGRVVRQLRPKLVGRLPVSPRTLALVRQGLWQVVNGKHGTARICRVKGIEISGKTGTSQVVGRKKGETGKVVRPAHRRAHAWFVAYAPSDNPRIAVAVVVEHGEHGSSAASPIARELIKTYLGEHSTDMKLVVRESPTPAGGRGG